MNDTIKMMEARTLIANRVPPGDRWKLISDETIFPSLTDALNDYYQKTGETLFTVDAKAGTVSVTTVIESEKKITKYSLYGEE